MTPALKRLKHLLLTPLIWLAAGVFLLEEAIWDWTGAIMARLGAVRAVRAVEQRIASLPPRWALFAFLVPGATLIPAKLFGLHAIATGRWLLGGAIIIIAKIAGLAFFSRIFNLTRPALMQLDWFARFYTWVMYYRNRIHDYLDHWEAYQRIKHRLSAIGNTIKTRLAATFAEAREKRN